MPRIGILNKKNDWFWPGLLISGLTVLSIKPKQLSKGVPLAVVALLYISSEWGLGMLSLIPLQSSVIVCLVDLVDHVVVYQA